MNNGSEIRRFAFQVHFPDEWKYTLLVHSKCSNVFVPPRTRDNIVQGKFLRYSWTCLQYLTQLPSLEVNNTAYRYLPCLFLLKWNARKVFFQNLFTVYVKSLFSSELLLIHYNLFYRNTNLILLESAGWWVESWSVPGVQIRGRGTEKLLALSVP